MGRKPKYPDAKQVIEAFFTAVSDSYQHPVNDDEVGNVSGRKKLEILADEFEISRLKVRKILITTGDLIFPETRQIQSLIADGVELDTICNKLGISRSTMNSLLPYQKGVYKLREVSAAAERTAIYRARLRAVHLLKSAVQNKTEEEQALALWQAVITFQGYLFQTYNWDKREGVRFKYIVSTNPGNDGKYYAGKNVEGYGNELWIIQGDKQSGKPITRFSMDYALKVVLERRKHGEQVTCPKQLKIYGSSYVCSLFRRFGLL